MTTRLRLVYLLASAASLARDIVAIVLFGAGGETDAVYLGLLPFMLLGSLVAADSMDNVVQPVLGARCGDDAIGPLDVRVVRTWAARTGLFLMTLALPLVGVVAVALWSAGGAGLGLAMIAAAVSWPAIYVTARSNVLASMVRRERYQMGVAYAILIMNLTGALLVATFSLAGFGVFSIVVGYVGSVVVYAIIIRGVAQRRLPMRKNVSRAHSVDEGDSGADDLRRKLRRSAGAVMATAMFGHLNVLTERLVAVFFGEGVITAVQYGRKFCVTTGGLLGGVQAVVDYPEWTRRSVPLELRRVLEVVGLGVVVSSIMIGSTRVLPDSVNGLDLIYSAIAAFAMVMPIYCAFVYVQRFLFALSEVRTIMFAMICMGIVPLPVILCLSVWINPIMSVATGFGTGVVLTLLLYWRRIETIRRACQVV